VRVLEDADPDQIAASLADGEFLWIDLQSPSAAEVYAVGAVLALHPLAVEDTRVFGQRAKVDRYGDDTFAVLFAAASTADGAAVPVEVHMYATGAFLLTVRQGPVPPLAPLHDHVAAHPPGPEDATVYRVIDAIVDTLGPALERQEDRLEALDDAILGGPRADQLEQIVALRRSTTTLRRRLAVQHEQFEALETAVLALPGIGDDARPYLRDVGHHVARAAADASAHAATLEAMTDT